MPAGSGVSALSVEEVAAQFPVLRNRSFGGRPVVYLDSAATSQTPDPVIDFMPDQRDLEIYGGTMRLGSYACRVDANSHSRTAYGSDEITERHRHRYEFNREYEALLTGAGLRITGSTPDGTYVEIVEIPGHPYFLGCQFHPEFKSKPLEPHPLFNAFIFASYENRSVRRARRQARELEQLRRPERVGSR